MAEPAGVGVSNPSDLPDDVKDILEDLPDNDDSLDLTPTGPIPVVVDNGGGLLKAGLASSPDKPYCVQSLVGTPKHTRVMLSSPSRFKFYGPSAYKQRGLCRLSHPIQRGMISNWTDMIELWQYLYDDILQINMKEHPLLITEIPKTAKSNRIRTAEIYLEYFETPSIYFAAPSVLALYATGRLSGCMLDSGHGVTYCTPIVDGYSIGHSITRMDIGGDDITKYLSSILSKCGDYQFKTSSELETVRIIKEKECILNRQAIDRMSNPTYHSTGIMDNRTASNLLTSKLSSLSGKLGASFNIGLSSKSGSALSRGSMNNTDDGPQYEMPDGTVLSIGNTHERAAEILFDPSLIGYTKSRGIQYLISESINKCDLNMRNRLYPNIYLVGGNCNIKNFEQRLINELREKIKSRKNMRNIHIRSATHMKDEAKHLIPFIGGTLIASNSQFQELAMTKQDFDEYGAGLLFRRSLC